jgi:hypothetical protein
MIRVVIAGQLKQGKSQLLNSLLNMPVARVGDDESTVLATIVSYGEQPSARLVVARPDGAEPEVVDIPPSELKPRSAPRPASRRTTGAAGRGGVRRARCCKGGLAFVDTPGWAGMGSRTCRRPWACCPTPTRC